MWQAILGLVYPVNQQPEAEYGQNPNASWAVPTALSSWMTPGKIGSSRSIHLQIVLQERVLYFIISSGTVPVSSTF
jgi:hypothetical protein